MKKLIKLFRPILIFGMRSLWFITRPKTSGAKVVITHKGEMLLIRTTYGYTYTLPGGGIKKNEMPEEAARREVMEEVGIKLGAVTALPSFISFAEYKQDTIYSFYSEVETKEYTLDLFEIDTAEWFPITSLPNVGPVTGKIIKLYMNR